MRIPFIGCLVLATVVVAACGRREGLRSRQAVQAAIEEHLKQNRQLQLNNMTTEIENVKLQGDTAQAWVKYRSKQSPQLAVQMRYSLRKAGGRWEVTSSSPAGGMGRNPHEGTDRAMPAPAPAAPRPQSSH